jgi:hypothetical protein
MKSLLKNADLLNLVSAVRNGAVVDNQGLPGGTNKTQQRKKRI